MPTGKTWNNFPQAIIRLHAKYCSNEGLARSSVYARNFLLYFFHGSYMWTTKTSNKQTVRKIKPFVFFLHKKMVAARSRFVGKVSFLGTVLKSLLPMVFICAIVASTGFEIVGNNDLNRW